MPQQTIHRKQDVLFKRFDYPENIIQQLKQMERCGWGWGVYDGLGAKERFKNPIDNLDI